MNIAIIRFNPDNYKGVKIPSCFKNTINGIVLDKRNIYDWEYRLEVLHYYIRQLIKYPPVKTLTEIKLFYDGYNCKTKLYN